MRTVIAMFDDSVSLERALDKLYASGIEEDTVRILGGNEGPDGMARGSADRASDLDNDVVAGNAAGAYATGGEPRVAASAGMGAFATPGSSTGMPMPAVAGTALFGGLRDYGIGDEEERFFSERMGQDSRVLVFRVHDDDASRVYRIVREAGASQVNDAGGR